MRGLVDELIVFELSLIFTSKLFLKLNFEQVILNAFKLIFGEHLGHF